MTQFNPHMKPLLGLEIEERLHIRKPAFEALVEEQNAEQDRLLDVITGVAKSMQDLQEQYILQLFGSEELTRELLPLFELEEYPVNIDVEHSDDGNLILLKTTQQFRLKLKETEQ